MVGKKSLVVSESIETKILTIRGQKVMLDADLAELYGVETKRLNEQVRRNSERFPEDFMFQLTAEEFAALRSQFATLKSGRGQHRKYMPYVFTEHGAIMAASVLNSPRAIEITASTSCAPLSICANWFPATRSLRKSSTNSNARLAHMTVPLLS